MTEIWKPVAGFEGIYEVSDRGRVRSLDRTIATTNNGRKSTAFLRGKVLKATVGSHGYRQVSLSKNADIRPACVHALVAAAFIGPNPGGMNVLHENGDKSNCRASNLYYGTQQDNLDDAKRHGATASGERNGRAKLTVPEVRAIRRSRATQYDLADRYGVTQGAISFIQRGETWIGVA